MHNPPGSTTGDAGNGSLRTGASKTVQIDTNGATTTGVPFSSSRTVDVPRRCWYKAGYTGEKYYDVWGPDGTVYTSPSANQHIEPTLHDGFEEYENETTGRWWEPVCSSRVPREESSAYYASHEPVYILPGQPDPPDDGGLSPEILAEVAFEHMDLPVGTIRWNPSLKGTGATLVNYETFVWVEDAATEVQVTASVPGVSSTVTGRMSTMALSAPGADSRSCTGTGTPYTPGMRKSDCFTVFHRSSSNQPVKEGQTLPTATLTATATWTATWTSSLDPTPRELDSQEIVTTAEVPVAEVQTLVTR